MAGYATRARCAWCGGPADPAGRRLVVCARCGCATTFPAPDEAELDAAYAGSYRPVTGRFSAGGDRLLRVSRATLARRVDRRAPPGPVLDVGCGEGVLLDALRARGRVAVGLERVQTRADVRVTPLERFDERVGEWAAVIFWHTLEHMRDPAAAIDRAVELLAPGGLLVVAVPNRASWQARRLGDRWLALDLPRHLVHLTVDALVEGVRARGLAVERASHWRGGQVVFGWLHGLVGALPGGPDLYDAIRRPEARARPIGAAARARTLAAAGALLPVAAALSAAEIVARRGGTICVEARKA